PDTTCLILNERLDLDTARLIGMDNAIGDYVLVLTLDRSILAALPLVIDSIRASRDAVFAVPQASSGHNGFAERFAYAVLSRLSGHTLSPEPITMAMFRREAALHLLNKHNAEILLKARSLGIGFAVTV